MAVPPTSARVHLPAWVSGGNPAGLIADCEYRSRRDGRSAGYLLQPQEAYRHSKPDLIRTRTVGGSTVSRNRFASLGELDERIEPVAVPAGIAGILERRKARAERTGELIDVVNEQLLRLALLPVKDLPPQAEYFQRTLRDVRFAEDPSDGPFMNAATHVVEVRPALLRRLKLASIWLRIAQDARLGSGDVTHVRAIAEQGLAFNASEGLYSGVYLLDAYLGPMLAAGSPGVWALSVHRTFGPLVFTLGAVVSGTSEDAPEFLQLIHAPGADERVRFPTLCARAGEAAVHWWGGWLNEMFGVMGDLAVFTNESGDYNPSKHLQAMLTLEQIFRRTTSMLLAHRDAHGRRALFFTLLDSLEAVTGWSILTTCDLGHASQTLERVENRMPPEAAEVLLPAARRAVDALRKMQDGFFIRRQLRTEDLELQVGLAAPKHLGVEEGVARYLKVLRDATHGHGSNRVAAAGLTDALLAHHDGHVPHDIGLLAYLYLLDVMSDPTRLRRVLYRSGR